MASTPYEDVTYHHTPASPYLRKYLNLPIQRWMQSKYWNWVILASFVLVFLLSAFAPDNLVTGFVYLLPIFLATIGPHPSYAFPAAFAATVLIILDLHGGFMADGTAERVSVFNRMLIYATLWLSATALYFYTKSKAGGLKFLRRQQIIVRFGREAVSSRDFNKIMNWMHRALTATFDSEYSKFLQYFPDEQKVVLVSGQGWDTEIAEKWNESTKDAATFSGYTLLHGEPVIVKEFKNEKRFRIPDLLIKHGIRSCVNIIVYGREHKPYGILEIDTKEPMRFESDDVIFLESMARLLGDAVERYELVNKLEQQTVSLSALNHELESFVAVVSHDLKEPIISVRILTETLEKLESFDSEIIKTYLRDIKDVSANMLAMLNSLLDYAHAEKEFKIETIFLNSVIREVCTEFGAQLRDKGAQVELGSLPSVMANRLEVKQVFANLLSNALKYSAPGRRPLIKFQAEDKGHEIEIAVRDNGIGMKPDEMRDIFKPFKRIEPAAEIPGSGMGLAICKRIAEKHGGSIRVESAPGTGSVFYVTFRAAYLALQSEVEKTPVAADNAQPLFPDLEKGELPAIPNLDKAS